MEEVSTRKRIFDIIQEGNKEDFLSRGFDVLLAITIFVNISVTFLQTFEELNEYHGLFKVVEIVTLSLFCVEYILRIITADYLYPDKSRRKAILRFLVSFDGVVDLLTIIPFSSLSGFVVFRLVRIIRIFHLFRINSTSDSVVIIRLVLKEKWRQIGFSVVIILVFMLASSLGIYSVEHEVQPEAFANAFSGLWWSMSTIFTVGYGDIYPITFIGRLIAIVLTFLGVGLVAIPTGIISAGFVEQYKYRSNSAIKRADISEIGEILIKKDDDFEGRCVEDITSDGTISILLVIRDRLHLVPNAGLFLQEGDILIVESERIKKNAKSRHMSAVMARKK